ncbi:hypothetical protein MTO98_13270 [Mucilaginibacter sp. SMC90]|uniref:hypothetical protein n=1 Tax=Mucilaginibacter sp. SMC90 TaxID=2929803 RepID=UPI001FB50CBF|nr:hypothetical protein [Mucilaginibacter sp. SMC90]UOE52051.1 hypothetical protein MTO98_13270 [Mucilaginibacter sp. SMC90]
MKKISNILVLAALALSACQKQPVIPNTMPLHKAKLTQTMVAADYKKLDTSSYGYKNGVFQSEDDAKQTIPALLATEYPRVDDGSTADITFNVGTPQVKVADSVYSNVAYTLTNADYLLLPGNKFTDFSAAQILSWLTYWPKTANPKANQLAVLTFNYYAGSVSVQTYGYLYLNNAWQQIYLLSPAQYASIGRSSHNEFVATDAGSVNTYINALLKADLTASTTAKVGDILYVSYNYYDGTDYQKVTAFAFDGNNWVAGSTPRTLSFERATGKWVVSSTVSYTLVKDDYTYIGTQTTAGTQAARDNVAKFPDFNISAATDATFWSDADLNAAMIAVLTEKFKATALPNQKFVVTYVVYSFGKTSNTSKTFVFDGTNFVVPQS